MSPPFPLGRKVEHDERSRAFAFTAPATLPTYSRTWRRRAAIFDQGSLGSCTGQAMAGWLGSDPRGRSTADKELAVDLYSAATRLDQWEGEWPPTDTGSSGLAVCKAAKQAGWITGYRHTFTFAAFLAALYTGPVIVGVPWHERMFRPLDSGYLDCGGPVVGGHEVLVRVSTRARSTSFAIIVGAMGTGRRGRFWLHWDDIEALLADDGDCTVPGTVMLYRHCDYSDCNTHQRLDSCIPSGWWTLTHEDGAEERHFCDADHLMRWAAANSQPLEVVE